MIIDTIDNSGNYENLGQRVSIALDHLRTADFDDKDPGGYDIDGDNIFVMVNEYNTRNSDECRLEAHRKYIDVQYMVRGTEWVGYAPLAGQTVTAEYDEERDVIFFKGDPSFVRLDKGMFAIFYPDDLHMPGTGDGETVRKVVVKIKI